MFFTGMPATSLLKSPTLPAKYILSRTVTPNSVILDSVRPRSVLTRVLEIELARDFALTEGLQLFFVPDVPTGEYQVVCKSICMSDTVVADLLLLVFGESGSGNLSPTFTIIHE